MRVLNLLLLAVTCLHSQQKDEWPQFRGNYQLTGVSTSAVPKTLKLLWTYDAGEPVESSAAIVDGVVYVGSYDYRLVALSVAIAIMASYAALDLAGRVTAARGGLLHRAR